MKTHLFKPFFVSIIIFFFYCGTFHAQALEPLVKIHYLGHSAFVLQFDNGITIVTDYGHYNAWVKWGWDSPIHSINDLKPDVLTYSHHHEDHYDPDRIPQGVTHILTDLDSLTIREIEIKPVRTCEDDITVESNSSYIFTYKGLKICHLGDAQAYIMAIDTTKVRNHITDLFKDTFDVLIMPIEGKQKFIPQAEKFIDLLKPKVIIPAHFWSQEYMENFLTYLETQKRSGKKYQTNRVNGAKFNFSGSATTDLIKVIVLDRAPFSVNRIEQ